MLFSSSVVDVLIIYEIDIVVNVYFNLYMKKPQPIRAGA
jgi:hypothetical protein